MFGLQNDCYVIAYLFSLKDFQSRGSKRIYTLIYTSSDKVFLMQSFQFISRCMEAIVKYLKVSYWNFLFKYCTKKLLFYIKLQIIVSVTYCFSMYEMI